MKTSSFNCKIYKEVFQNIYDSYLKKNKFASFVYKGGGASGKSENIAKNIIFWLPERAKDEAVVIVYSAKHKNNTLTRFQRILSEEKIPFNSKKSDDGRIEITFGNQNKITIISVKTSSIEEMTENLKTFTTVNDKAMKFLWFEEFTATLNEFKSIDKFDFAVSRLNRELREDSITMYSFNPPPNHKHIVFDWLSKFKGKVIHSTIYDLPEAWQSKEDLKKAAEMKEDNILRFKSIYLGEAVGIEGLAYNCKKILTEDIKNYTSFEVFTDNGVKDATAFILFGFHDDGVHVLDTYYYSGRINEPKTSSEFVTELINFLNKHNLPMNTTVITDDLDFTNQCIKQGFFKAKYISNVAPKKRALYYKQTANLIDDGKLKILNTPNNQITYQQLSNAEVEDKLIRGIYQTVVKKVDNNNVAEEYQLHAIDPIHYFCLVNYKRLGGR